MDLLLRRISTWVIVACVLALTGTFAGIAAPPLKARLGLTSPEKTGYAVGDRIDLPRSLYTSTERSVFVFSSAMCPACRRSADAIGAMTAQLKGVARTQVVLLTPLTAREDELAFAASVGVETTHVLPTELGQFRVRRVPTFVLADNGGKILFVYEGILTEAARQDIVHMAVAPSSAVE